MRAQRGRQPRRRAALNTALHTALNTALNTVDDTGTARSPAGETHDRAPLAYGETMDPAATSAPAAPAVLAAPTATDLRFAVVDVETSGLSTKRNRVLQVAVVTIDGEGTVIDAWSSLVRPRNRWLFRLGPRHIHGLTRARLRAAPSATEVLAELSRRLDGSTFTAHNAAFDAAFLRRMAAGRATALTLTPQLCTLRLSRQLDPDRKLSHRLADVTERYGVRNGRPHDALEDALATAAVLPHLLRAHGVSNGDQLSRLIDS